MKRKLAWGLALLVFVASSQAGAAEPKVIHAAHYFSTITFRKADGTKKMEKHAWQQGLEKFREVAEDSGLFKVVIHNGKELGDERNYFTLLNRGSLQMAVASMASGSDYPGIVDFLDLPFLWHDHRHWQECLDGQIGQEIADIIEKKSREKGTTKGIHILAYWGGVRRNILAIRSVYKRGDLRGLRFRVQQSKIQEELWQYLGATPVQMSLDQTRVALEQGNNHVQAGMPPQKGDVHALEQEAINAYPKKLYHPAKYITETGHQITVRPLLMAGSFWDTLLPEERKVVQEAARQATEVARRVEQLQDAAAIREMQRDGAIFLSFPEEQRQEWREFTQEFSYAKAERSGMLKILEKIEKAGNAKSAAK